MSHRNPRSLGCRVGMVELSWWSGRSEVEGICRSGSRWQAVLEAMYPQPMSQNSSQTAANQLDNASSSYLRSARHQPVQWHSWGKLRSPAPKPKTSLFFWILGLSGAIGAT